MRMTGTPLCFAKRRRQAATSFIWLTEPGADSTLEENIVWTESTIIRSGRILEAASMMSSMQVSQKMKQSSVLLPSLSARILTWAALSSPVT